MRCIMHIDDNDRVHFENNETFTLYLPFGYEHGTNANLELVPCECKQIRETPKAILIGEKGTSNKGVWVPRGYVIPWGHSDKGFTFNSRFKPNAEQMSIFAQFIKHSRKAEQEEDEKRELAEKVKEEIKKKLKEQHNPAYALKKDDTFKLYVPIKYHEYGADFKYTSNKLLPVPLKVIDARDKAIEIDYRHKGSDVGNWLWVPRHVLKKYKDGFIIDETKKLSFKSTDRDMKKFQNKLGDMAFYEHRETEPEFAKENEKVLYL